VPADIRSEAVGSDCAGRLARSVLADGPKVLWQSAKTHAIFVVDERDAKDAVTVEEFNGAVYGDEIRFETPDFMHLRELAGQQRDWYRIVRDLRHAACAARPAWVAHYLRYRSRWINDDEDWTYVAAQRHIRWRLYWAGRRLRGLPFESFLVALTPRGVAMSIDVECLSASEHGIDLWQTRTGTHDAHRDDRALRRADAVAPGILLASGPSPKAARIGSTTIGLAVEPPYGTLSRNAWTAILRRLRATP
jgi:hypothetical protein